MFRNISCFHEVAANLTSIFLGRLLFCTVRGPRRHAVTMFSGLSVTPISYDVLDMLLGTFDTKNAS